MLVLSICKVKKFIYLTFLFLGISMFLPTMAFASRTDNHVAKYTVFGQGPLVKVGSVPAVSKSLYKTGVINSGEEMSVNIFLKPRNVSTMNSLLASVYNPSSPDYHHFLKKGQFAAEFGPTKSTYNTVINYLKSVGISDISSGSGDFSVSIKAKSGQLSKVFDTSFMGYKLSDGRKVYANTKAPLLPQTIANATLGVAGFNDMAVMVSNALKGEPISHLVSGKDIRYLFKAISNRKLFLPIPLPALQASQPRTESQLIHVRPMSNPAYLHPAMPHGRTHS